MHPDLVLDRVMVMEGASQVEAVQTAGAKAQPEIHQGKEIQIVGSITRLLARLHLTRLEINNII
jgi:RecJ-like exonuclease